MNTSVQHVPERPTTSDPAVGSTRLVSRLRAHLRDMDAGVRMKRVAIKEAVAAADQMEHDKLILETEVDRIEKEMANVQDQRPPPGDVGLAEGAIGGSLHPVVGASGQKTNEKKGNEI